MNFDTLITELKLDHEPRGWRDAFNQPAPPYNPDSFWLLDESALHQTCKDIDLSDSLTNAFISALPALRSNTPLMHLLWHFHHAIFDDLSLDQSRKIDLNIPIHKKLPPVAQMFYPFLLISGLPKLLQLYNAHNIPHAVLVETLSDLEIKMNNHRGHHNTWGLQYGYWLIQHFTARLFRLGRLQFQLNPFFLPFNIYQKINSADLIAFPTDNLDFRQDGQFYNANKAKYSHNRFTASFHTDQNQIIGHPVNELGSVEQTPVTLDASQWQLVLKPQDPILNIHIPFGGRLTPQVVNQSFSAALLFFPKHFPQYQFRAFVCQAWLLDRQLADYLPPTSNLVRFLSLFNTLPSPNASDMTSTNKPPQQRTSLEQAVTTHLQNNKHWHSASGYITPTQAKLFTKNFNP